MEICGYIYTPRLIKIKPSDIKSEFLANPLFAFGLSLPVG